MLLKHSTCLILGSHHQVPICKNITTYFLLLLILHYFEWIADFPLDLLQSILFIAV
jgi:hypothetical protein